MRFLFENFTEDTDCLSDLQPGISCGSFACPRFRLSAKPITKAAIHPLLDDLLAVRPVLDSHLFLTVNTNKTKLPILYSDIQYIISDSNYLIIHTSEEIRCRMLFRDVTRTLSEDERFLTINRGVMVNLDYVSSMDGAVCMMNDGASFSMNKKQSNTLQQTYITWQFTQRTKSLLHGGLS